MRGYRAFLGKELKEQIRNYKLLILIILFSIVGLLSPLTAKFLPRIMENLVDENMTILIADPIYIDSWIQFFSNTNQISLVAILLIFSPILAREYEKGTLVHMVTKGLSRRVIVLTKATVLYVSWTIGYWLSLLITLAYTHFYFPDSTTQGLLLASLALYSFGLLLLTILMTGAVLFKNTFAPLLTVGVFVILSFLADLIPALHEWNPLQLATRNIELLVLKETDQLLIQAFGVNFALIILLLVLSIVIFNKKEL